MRRFMRAATVDRRVDEAIARDVGMEPDEIEEMFRMVAIGDYDDRYAAEAPREVSPAAFAEQGSCGIDFAEGAAVLPADAFATGEDTSRARTSICASIWSGREGGGDG